MVGRVGALIFWRGGLEGRWPHGVARGPLGDPRGPKWPKMELDPRGSGLPLQVGFRLPKARLLPPGGSGFGSVRAGSEVGQELGASVANPLLTAVDLSCRISLFDLFAPSFYFLLRLDTLYYQGLR